MTAVPRSGTVAPLVGSEGRGGGVLRRGELVADQAAGRDRRPALLPPLCPLARSRCVCRKGEGNQDRWDISFHSPHVPVYLMDMTSV